jgi:hypothetical protein
MYRYNNGWIDANGNPKPTDFVALRKELTLLTDVGGTAAALGTAACITFAPCAAGAVTGGALAGTGLSVLNSVLQSSPSSTPIDFAIDSAAGFSPKSFRFVTQVGAEFFKKTDAVENVKKTVDDNVKANQKK